MLSTSHTPVSIHTFAVTMRLYERVCVRVLCIPYIISLPFVAVIRMFRMFKMKIIPVTFVGDFQHIMSLAVL